MAVSHLIIGLGNPGDEYARTRHNIGFMAVDEIAAHYHCAPWKKKFRGLTTGDDNFLLLKPLTFMNLSGESANEALQFYQLAPEKVIVFHDDLDLLPGQIKIKQGGGTGGHNGLKSLDAHIGQNYWRVRLGIGRPLTEQGDIVKGDVVSNYVLNPFSKSDKIWLDKLIPALAAEFDLIRKEKFTEYLAKLVK
jgi:PTH1 family peptidyl-tRNA hydrolase